MRHITCDSCSKDLTGGGASHYTVTMEANKVAADAGLTDDDFEPYSESDSVHEMQLMLDGAFEPGIEDDEPNIGLLRKEYDFCKQCYVKFSADPLGLDRVSHRRFSAN